VHLHTYYNIYYQSVNRMDLVITHMLHYARDSFTAEVAKHAKKASFVSLCGLSVLCGEIWVITRMDK